LEINKLLFDGDMAETLLLADGTQKAATLLLHEVNTYLRSNFSADGEKRLFINEGVYDPNATISEVYSSIPGSSAADQIKKYGKFIETEKMLDDFVYASQQDAAQPSTHPEISNPKYTSVVASRGKLFEFYLGNIDGVTPNFVGFVEATALALPETFSLPRGTAQTLTATTEPPEAAERVIWKSSKPEIATVFQNGVVTGVKLGKTTITATVDGLSESCEVTVTVPMLPVAKVINNGVELLQATDYQGGVSQFVLEWTEPESPDGPLDDGPDGPNIIALKLVYQRWKEYEQYMDSRPYYPPVDLKSYEVWSNLGLMNKSTKGVELGILRYWPQDLLEKDPPEPLTVASWYTEASNARRKADFLAVKTQVEAQMAALKASPFWDVWYLQGTEVHCYPLREMWQDMRNFISAGDIPEVYLYMDSPWADYYDAGRNPVRHNVGDLYTVFFGPIPKKTDYVEQEPTSYYVFPVE
jgi:hypothetical protein